MLDVGQSLGDFRIVARLKAGGMANLFLGQRRGAKGFAKPVAIKVVHSHLASNSDFVRMFVDEAKLSALIEHPSVVHIEELGEADGVLYLVMEYVHGFALNEILKKLSTLERRLSPELATWVALQVAGGLHAAHELTSKRGDPLNVVHRDISPQNVLVSAHGHVKLIDFGIAKIRGRGSTQAGSLKGKIAYMSPEQANGDRVDRRTDVYALGVVLWEMLTTRRLFSAADQLALIDMVRDPDVDPPSKYAADVPPELDAAVLDALAADVDQRLPTARAFRNRLIKAVPEAATLEADALAELIADTMEDELGRANERLPKDLSSTLAPTGGAATRISGAGLHKRTLPAVQAHYVPQPGESMRPDDDDVTATVPDRPTGPFGAKTLPNAPPVSADDSGASPASAAQPVEPAPTATPTAAAARPAAEPVPSKSSLGIWIVVLGALAGIGAVAVATVWLGPSMLGTTTDESSAGAGTELHGAPPAAADVADAVETIDDAGVPPPDAAGPTPDAGPPAELATDAPDPSPRMRTKRRGGRMGMRGAMSSDDEPEDPFRLESAEDF